MGAELSLDLLSRLLKLRVVLAGEGAFRLQPNPDSNAYGALCVLPGNSSAVRLWSGLGAKPWAQMFRPDGQTLSREIDIRSPVGFASLVHNSDVEIWVGDGEGRLGTAAKRVSTAPSELADLVNAAVASDEPTIIAACDALYDHGSSVDFPEQDGRWSPSSDAWRFVEACQTSADDAVCAAAIAIEEIIVEERRSRAFSVRESLIRSNEWVGEYMAGKPEPDDTVEAEDVRWQRLKTPAAVTAVARSLDWLEGHFLNDTLTNLLRPGNKKAPNPSGVRSGQQAMRSARPGSGASARSGVVRQELDADREFWALVGDNSERLALGCVEDGDVVVVGRRGQDDGIMIEHFDAIMMLRGARLPDQDIGPSGPRL